VDEDNNLIFHKKFRKKLTNNELEYEAILAAFRIITKDDIIISDSKLCVEQILGKFKVKKENLKPYAEKARSILKKKNLTIKWMSRDVNLAGKYLEKIVKAHARKRNKESKALRGANGK